MPDYNLGTARGRIEIDTGGVKQNTDEAGKAVDGLGSKMDKIAPKGGAIQRGLQAAAIGIVGGFGLAVKSAADFESQISGIAAVSGATGAELDSIRSKALQLGKDTQFSASESAAAMEELIKAGIPIKAVLEGAADGAVALAAAGGVAIPEAATLASNAMNAFGIEAKDLGGVVDTIAGAANASAIDVGEFGQSLQQVGAVANLAGLSFDDTAVAIAELGNAGIKGSDAGTSLKTFLQNLIPVTDKEKGLMQELGIIAVDTGTAMKTLATKGIKPASTSFNDIIASIEKYNEANGGAKVGTAKAGKEALAYAQKLGVVRNQFFDAQGNTKKLADIQQVLANSLKGMSKEQKLATLQTLFGSDAIRAAAVLADNGAAGYEKLAGAIGKTTAADVAAKRMDNLKGQMEQLKGSLETAGIVIGTILLPAVRAVVVFFTNLLNKFLELSPTTQKIIMAMLGLVAAVAIGILAFIKIMGVIKQFKAAMMLLQTMSKLSGLMKFIFGPWGLAILAIIVLAYLIYKNWDTIKALLIQVWGIIVSAFTAVWSRISAVAMAVFNAVKGVVMSVIGFIVGFITGALGVLLAIWSAYWGMFGGLITAVFGLIWSIIKLAFAIIMLIIRVALAVIVGFVTFYFNLVKTIIMAVFNFIKPYVQMIWNGIVGIIKWAVDKVKYYINLIRAIIAVVKEVFGKVLSAAKEKLQPLIDFVGTIKQKILDAFSFGKDLFNKGKEIIQSIIDGVMSMINSVSDAIGKVTDKITGFLPGSPVKEGPLRVLNNGYAGGQISNMLAEGIEERMPQVRKALLGISMDLPTAASAGIADSTVILPTQITRSEAEPVAGPRVQIDVHNPVSEKTSVTVTKTMNRLALLEAI